MLGNLDGGKLMSTESISWGELAELTHATQVEKFNFCMCEDNEGRKIYADCPPYLTLS
jgi:hypothetical protein